MPFDKQNQSKRAQSRLGAGDKRAQHRKITSEIAYRAARLIAEDGILGFASAKLKAARQMGVTEGGLLPNDQEIDDALRTQQSIFQSSSQPMECDDLRRVAVEAMRWLDQFNPYLVGAVLDGSANRFSLIELEIVTEDAKKFELFFAERADSLYNPRSTSGLLASRQQPRRVFAIRGVAGRYTCRYYALSKSCGKNGERLTKGTRVCVGEPGRGRTIAPVLTQYESHFLVNNAAASSAK